MTSPAAWWATSWRQGQFSLSFEKGNLICREGGGALVIVVQAQRTGASSTDFGTERDWYALRTAVQLGVAGGSTHFNSLVVNKQVWRGLN